jgi:hypothetical protein
LTNIIKWSTKMPQKVDKVMAQDTLLPQTEESLPPSFNNNEFPTTKLCL